MKKESFFIRSLFSVLKISWDYPQVRARELPLLKVNLSPFPLRILIMISSPEDSSYNAILNYENEEIAILKSFEQLLQSGDVEIHFTNNGSLFELREKVQNNKYSIFHFSGHGSVKNGRGSLILWLVANELILD